MDDTSIWNRTLHDLRNELSSNAPVPAGVSICAATASLALALLTKVLVVTRTHKTLETDLAELDSLIESAQHESLRLAQLADDDARAFTRYLDCVRNRQSPVAAMREAIEVPMEAARAAARGVKLCRRAAAFCSRGLMQADLGIAASLLSGAGHAMLLSVETNLAQLSSDDPFGQEVSTELPMLTNYLQ